MSTVRNGPSGKIDDSSGEMLKSVLLVDDHAVMRYGLQRLFERELPNAVIGEARSGAEALDLLRQSKWQLMLLDMMMPDCDGLEVLNRIRLISCCETKVIILTGTCDPHLAALALKAGASGYVTKCGSFDEIPMAVKAVLSGKRYLSRDIQTGVPCASKHG
jgi:two-component system invasion response regulator UvrY